MSEWKIYRLGDICKNVCSGGTPKSTEPLYYGGDIPWLNTKEVDFCRIAKTEKTITDSGFQNSSTKWIDKNSVIVAMYGATAAKVAVNTIPLTTNQACCNLMIDPNLADFRFVYFYLCYKYTSLVALANGGAQQNLNTQRIKDFEITLPLLKEQKCIADILWALDDKIELNRRINANLEEQAQALFKSWFVDFEPFRDSLFVDSELGKIPQGWKEGNYTDIVEIRGGGTPKTDMQEYWNGNIPFFSPKDVGAGCFILDTEKHITAKGLENCNSSLFQPNTVFITARGTVGKVVMSGTEMAMNQTNYALLGKQNIPQYYVYHITLQLVGRLLKKANGAVFNAITTRDFACEQIVIPPYSTIKHFSDIVKPIYENILLNEVQSNRLSALRDTLLPKLMSGEISVEKGFTD